MVSREVLYLAIITNLTLFMTYSMTYNEKKRKIKPVSRFISSNEVTVTSSFDKYLEKVEKAIGEDSKYKIIEPKYNILSLPPLPANLRKSILRALLCSYAPA